MLSFENITEGDSAVEPGEHQARGLWGHAPLEKI